MIEFQTANTILSFIKLAVTPLAPRPYKFHLRPWRRDLLGGTPHYIFATSMCACLKIKYLETIQELIVSFRSPLKVETLSTRTFCSCYPVSAREKAFNIYWNNRIMFLFKEKLTKSIKGCLQLKKRTYLCTLTLDHWNLAF